MHVYRIPALRNQVTVNGRTYNADSNGLFSPATQEDADEMRKMGAVQDAFPGAYDDLRFPAQSINPAGAVAAPGVDTTLSAFPGTLLFSGIAENVITGVAQLPHHWERYSNIRPHIHWSKITGSADAVDWVLYYRHVGMVGDAPGNWIGPVAGTLVAGDPTNADEHLITSFGEIDMARKIESSIIAWRLHRLGATDADGNYVRLYELDFHYRVGSGKFGTDAEIPS